MSVFAMASTASITIISEVRMTVRQRARLASMQRQLLHSPVEKLRDIDLFLARTGDLVDPAELLRLLARFAQHTEHLAVERELVDAARECVRAEEHLIRTRCDA